MFYKFARCVIAAFLFVQTALIAAEANECGEQKLSQMQTVIVAPQDLHFDQDNIWMNMNGHLYEIHSLKKRGHQWLAEVDAAVGQTCAWGHPLCGYCELCHQRICPLYQSRCTRSK